MILVNAAPAQVQAALAGRRCTSMARGRDPFTFTATFENAPGDREFHAEHRDPAALETGGAVVELVAEGPSRGSWAVVVRTA